MSYPPEDHEILSIAYDGIKSQLASNEWSDVTWVKKVSLQSECIEFYDEANEQWYEIVVRPIDNSSEELDAGEEETEA